MTYAVAKLENVPLMGGALFVLCSLYPFVGKADGCLYERTPRGKVSWDKYK